MAAKTREWSVSLIAAFLFAAVLKLAQSCDGARMIDGSGFNKFDTERGHRFADEDPDTWDAKKCSYVRKFLWKYRGQLLDFHNIDLTEVPDALQLKQSPRAIKFKRSYGGQFIISWDYDDAQFGEIKDAVKALDQRRYEGGVKVWVVPGELAEEVAELAGRFGFDLSDGARRVIGGEIELTLPPNIRDGVGDNNLEFEFPYDSQIVGALKVTWEFRHWDREDRVWRVNVDTHEAVIAVADFAKRFNLTMSDEVAAMVAQEEAHARAPERASHVPPSDDDLYGEPGGEPEPREDIEDYHKRTEMGRSWTAGNAFKLFE